MKIERDGERFLFECLHCKCLIQVLVKEINCSIFRHGSFKATGQNIPPHSTKEQIDDAIKKDMIFGCGKPFKLSKNGELEKCEYI